jgi:hypothetical protein
MEPTTIEEEYRRLRALIAALRAGEQFANREIRAASHRELEDRKPPSGGSGV